MNIHSNFSEEANMKLFVTLVIAAWTLTVIVVLVKKKN